MTPLMGQWSYVIAAALFGAIALTQLRRDAKSYGGRALATGLLITAVSALAVAFKVENAGDTLPGWGELALVQLRHLGWLAFLYLLWRRGQRHGQYVAVGMLYAVIASLFLALGLLPEIVGALDPAAATSRPVLLIESLIQILTIVGALVLVHNLYNAASIEERDALRLPLLAITAMWIFDLNLFTVAYLTRSWPIELFKLHGVVLILAAPLFGLSVQQNRSLTLRLSRTAALQSAGLVAIGGYLVAMFAVTVALDMLGGETGRLAQISFVFAASLAALLLGPSARFRAWFRVKISKHLFQHRYDYRAEWLRFTDTLGRPGERSAALDVRVVQAVADIVESPSGLLLAPDGNGLLITRARWNWELPEPPASGTLTALGNHLAGSSRVIELDALRAIAAKDHAHDEIALVPEWIFSEQSIWALVPLVHFGKLTAVVVLTRPSLNRTLDWEDFDLLRVVGRQGASYIAEARVHEELSDALRFDEFNRRFAFIMHDIKNLVSQLSLVTRNAERHADNPEFRADMIETLKSSTARMNALLARLSQHNKGKQEEPRTGKVGEIAQRVITAKKAQHPLLLAGDMALHAVFDPARLEQALSHLVQNAIEASAPAEPVTVRVNQKGAEVVIDVIDEGCGMSAAFIDSKLFKPFTSTKAGGFGIGTFEARSDIFEMGGRLSVSSREGQGTTFTVTLPVQTEFAGSDHIPKAIAA